MESGFSYRSRLVQLAGIYLLAFRACRDCLHDKLNVWVDGSEVFDAFLELVSASPRLFLQGRSASVSCPPYLVTADCCYFPWTQASCRKACMPFKEACRSDVPARPCLAECVLQQQSDPSAAAHRPMPSHRTAHQQIIPIQRAREKISKAYAPPTNLLHQGLGRQHLASPVWP